MGDHKTTTTCSSQCCDHLPPPPQKLFGVLVLSDTVTGTETELLSSWTAGDWWTAGTGTKCGHAIGDEQGNEFLLDEWLVGDEDHMKGWMINDWGQFLQTMSRSTSSEMRATRGGKVNAASAMWGARMRMLVFWFSVDIYTGTETEPISSWTAGAWQTGTGTDSAGMTLMNRAMSSCSTNGLSVMRTIWRDGWLMTGVSFL